MKAGLNLVHHDGRKGQCTRGFTLLEVAVAVAILGWVLGSAIMLVSQYADERRLLRERFLGAQVAWNQLLEEYRSSLGWQGLSTPRVYPQGEVALGGQYWQFSTVMEPTVGSGLFRYQVTVQDSESGRQVANLALFLTATGRTEP
jgi:type II secretion system protein I